MKLAHAMTLICLVAALACSSAGPESDSKPLVAADSIASGEAWRAFCERLAEIGSVVTSEGVPDSELDRLEGYRYLLATLAESIDSALYRSDLTEPQLRFNITKYRAPAMPSSDARYLSAEIAGEGIYRLSGTLGNAPHITVQAYGGVGALESFDVSGAADREGRFSIMIGGPERDDAWMPISPSATMLYFREYFSDWDTARPSEFVLERLDRPARGTPLTAPALGRVFEETIGKLEAQVPYWKARMEAIRSAHDNTLSPPGEIGDVGLGDILYGTGWFDLEPDQALLIELSPPDAVHWSFQLGNYWGEFLDFTNYTSSLNGRQAVVGGDGIYRLVIAHSDPGVPNWLDTAGHREGMIFYRYHLSKSKPVPSYRLVNLSRLRDILPADTPHVSAEERHTEIDRRRAAVARRWAP